MIIVLVLLLMSPAWAWAVDIGQANIPYTISSAGTYELTENISYAGGNAITIATTGNVVIQGKGGTKYSLTLTGGHGIYSNNNYGAVTINDLTINMNDNNDCIRFANSSGAAKTVIVHDVDMNISLDYSGEANGVYFPGGGSPATINGAMYNCIVTFSGLYTGSNRSSAFAVTYSPTSSSTPFEIYSNTITITGRMTNAIRLYCSDYFVVRDNTITADSGADNIKGIQIDGEAGCGSDYCKVYSNTIDINSTDNYSGSHGIRVRFGASNCEVYSNTINVADSTGSYASAGISFGGDEGIECNSNLIHHNTVIGSGGNIPLMFYNASGDGAGNDFYCNTLTNTGNGTCIYFYPVDSSTPVQNLRFSGDALTTSGSYAITMPSFCDGGALSDVTFCSVTMNGSDLVAGGVDDVDAVGGWSITTAPCAYSCDAALQPTMQGCTIIGGGIR